VEKRRRDSFWGGEGRRGGNRTSEEVCGMCLPQRKEGEKKRWGDGQMVNQSLLRE